MGGTWCGSDAEGPRRAAGDERCNGGIWKEVSRLEVEHLHRHMLLGTAKPSGSPKNFEDMD